MDIFTLVLPDISSTLGLDNLRVSSLLEAPTLWNSWLDEDGHGILSWPYLVAMLLRDLPVSFIGEPFARAVETAASGVESACITGYGNSSKIEHEPVTFEHWLALWSDVPFAQVLCSELLECAQNFDGDISFGLKVLARSDAWPEASFWFLAGSIANWLGCTKSDDLATSLIEKYEWLGVLEGVRGAEAAEKIFVTQYIRFFERKLCPAIYLPESIIGQANALNIELYAPPFETIRPLDQTLIMAEQWPNKLLNILGRGPEWPGAAANIRTARVHGLICWNELSLTAKGRRALERVYVKNRITVS